MAIRVLLADDHRAARTSIRRILEHAADITVAGEAEDGVSAVALAQELRPDVALVDVRMPGLDGIEVTRQLAGPDARVPVRVVVVTTFDLDEFVYPALRHGASGFLLKRSGPALLVEGVRAAVAGDSLVSPSVTVRLLRDLGHTRSPRTPAIASDLTTREAEVAGLVAHGLTNPQIAERLTVEPGTVKTHVANVQRKLGVANRVGIAVWAWKQGSVGLDPELGDGRRDGGSD